MRIYLHDHSNEFRLCLFGELNESASLELERCWRAALSIADVRKITIDATGLTAIGEDGMTLLNRMVRAGTRIAVSRISPAAGLLGFLGPAIEHTAGEARVSFVQRVGQLAARTRLRCF